MRRTVDMLATPRADFGEFVAGLAHLPMITPEEARQALDARLADRRAELARHRADLDQAPGGLPRLVLLEEHPASK